MENRAIGVGWKGDTTPIYKAKLAAIPEHLAEVDRPTYDALVKDAESYNGKQLSLKQLRALRATNNAMLDKYYGKTDFGQYNDMASHVRSSSLRAETEAARDIIAKGVDPEHGGEQYQELNDRLKSILDFKEAHENLYRDLRVTPAQQAKGGYNFSIFDLTSPEATAKAAGKALVQKYTRPDKSPYDSVARINKALDAYNNYTDEAAAKYKLPPKSIPRVAPTLSGYPPMKINLEPTPPPGSMRLNQQQLFPEGQEAGEGANDIGGILGRAETGQFPAEPIGSNRPLEQRMKQPEYKMFPWLKP
jgi:hypothetical protein